MDNDGTPYGKPFEEVLRPAIEGGTLRLTLERTFTLSGMRDVVRLETPPPTTGKWHNLIAPAAFIVADAGDSWPQLLRTLAVALELAAERAG